MADLYITDAKCILAFHKVKTEYQWRTTAIRLEKLDMQKIADTTKTLIKQMKNLTDEERKNIINEITNNYCYYCGNEYLSCYCMRDD